MTRRKIKSFIAIFFCLFTVIGLTSCIGKKSEKMVANIIIEDMIEHYKFPGSVTVTEADITKDGCIARCKIGGKNSYGSMNYTTYYFVLKDFTDSHGESYAAGYWCSQDAEGAKPIYLRYDYVIKSLEGNKELSINKINKLLNKWKKTNGYS